jgi:hypothetical protein
LIMIQRALEGNQSDQILELINGRMR